MKKLISVVLILAMVFTMFALVGCGNNGDDENMVKVTIVVPAGFGDKSFNDSAKEGGDQLDKDFENVKVNYIECNGENFKQHMMDAADAANIVVCVGWEFWEIDEVVQEYPDVKFIWVDNQSEGTYDNLLSIIYAQNEGSFLAGYVAAKMSTTGVIGAVGGEDSVTINDFVVGYKQGAQYANPAVKVINNNASGDYENPSLGKELALALNDQGADVIFQVAGNTGSGVFNAAQEKGFYAIGVDQDQKITAAAFDNEIICSMVKKVGQSIYDVISEFVSTGTMKTGTWVADMANNYIGLVYGDESSKQQVSDALKADVEELSKKIVAGEIKVETTRK